MIAFRSCLTYDLLYDRTSHNSDRQWFYFWPNIMVGLDRENTASYGDIKQISAVVHMYLLVVGYSTILTEIHPRPRHPKRLSNPLQIVKKGLLNKKKNSCQQMIAFQSCLTSDFLYDRTSHNTDRSWFNFWPN